MLRRLIKWLPLYRTTRLHVALKAALLFAPPLFDLWLALSVAGSALVGVGYVFFTPWVSASEAFKEDIERPRDSSIALWYVESQIIVSLSFLE